MEYITLDVHKKYTWARVENTKGDRLYESRLGHTHGTIKNFVNRWTAGSPVAVETVGNWYWVVDEIEAGGGKPQLVNARLAKLMMGSVNKSDKLDTKGMNRLQRAGTLPTVWTHPLRFVTPASCRARAWCSAGTPQDDIATQSLDGKELGNWWPS
jgi:hypothetical protein